MFIHEINLIKRIDPSNPLELNQVTVYLILKNEKEKNRIEGAINAIRHIMDDPRCPYKKLVILYRTRELMNRIGDRSTIAAFQEYNIMVRLFNHPTNHDYKYSFGLLSNLDDPFWVKVDFLQFLSEAACENLISLTASLWLYEEYSRYDLERTIRYYIPLVTLRSEKGTDSDILTRWNDRRQSYKLNWTIERNLEEINHVAQEINYTIKDYVNDVQELPVSIYGSGSMTEINENEIHIKLIPGQYRQKIDLLVEYRGVGFPFHLRTKTGLFIYMCVLLSKKHNFKLLREYFQHQKSIGYFRRYGRRCTVWMHQLFNWITLCSGDFAEMYSLLAGGQYDYQTLNNEISKINNAIRTDIQDPLIQEKCIIKSEGLVGETSYYIELLSDNIDLVAPFEKPDIVVLEEITRNIIDEFFRRNVVSDRDISRIKPEDERELPEGITQNDILDLSYEK